MNDSDSQSWLICQIGAREHYAVARALHTQDMLAGLFTDFWIPTTHPLTRLPRIQRLADRFHPDLANAKVHAPNARFLAFELKQRVAKRSGWPATLDRNDLFQKMVIKSLSSISQPKDNRHPITLFSYSYAALELFRYAKSRGWKTVLGQIDPGPEEERIVSAEYRRYSNLSSKWKPAPTEYWQSWHKELELADRIIVNSEWSRQCLVKEGASDHKLEIVPLVYGEKTQDARPEEDAIHSQPTRVLFLGQIVLRKGIGRLLDAMRLLKEEPVELILAGPSEIDPSAWADLPKVRWIGPVPRGEVGKIYQNADCFILPTLSDGYALTQLEALSCGLPVIASKHCGAAVTHGRNGWILENLEPETIAAAIRHAMSEKLPDVRPPEFSLENLANRLLTPAS